MGTARGAVGLPQLGSRAEEYRRHADQAPKAIAPTTTSLGMTVLSDAPISDEQMRDPLFAGALAGDPAGVASLHGGCG